MSEMPTMMSAKYVSKTLSDLDWLQSHAAKEIALRRLEGPQLAAASLNHFQHVQPQPLLFGKPGDKMPASRIVKVYVADINDNIPLANRILYTGMEKLTDSTDQELFFEVPMSELLAIHNATRAVTVDKAQSAKFGRDIFLEPAKIRDLKMVVVEVATF